MQFSVHAAKSQLSKLIDAALAGEEVVIAKGSRPVVRLVALPQSAFRLGVMSGLISGPVPDFLEPATDEEIAGWEGG